MIDAGCGSPWSSSTSAGGTVSVADADTLRRRRHRAAVLADLLAGYVRIGQPRACRMPLYDPVAAAAFIDPATVGFRPARIDAELAGRLTRGVP